MPFCGGSDDGRRRPPPVTHESHAADAWRRPAPVPIRCVGRPGEEACEALRTLICNLQIPGHTELYLRTEVRDQIAQRAACV